MGNKLVIYKSKYGATKKYATMLAKRYDFDIVDVKDFRSTILPHYDVIVLAGAIYASGISGIKVLQKNYAEMKDKVVAIFCVGASPYDEKALTEIKNHNLKGDIKDLPLFYGRGAWNEHKMSLKDRTLCKMLKKVVAKKDPETYEPWEEALISAFGGQHDWTDACYLKPLLTYIQTNSK